jgi:hypothetical protein
MTHHINNLFCAVSQKQFNEYVKEARSAFETSFDVGSKVKITVMDNIPRYALIDNDFLQENIQTFNELNTKMIAENIDDVTEDVWKNAAFVRATIYPADTPEGSMPHSRIEMDFKGKAPRQASFKAITANKRLESLAGHFKNQMEKKHPATTSEDKKPYAHSIDVGQSLPKKIVTALNLKSGPSV